MAIPAAKYRIGETVRNLMDGSTGTVATLRWDDTDGQWLYEVIGGGMNYEVGEGQLVPTELKVSNGAASAVRGAGSFGTIALVLGGVVLLSRLLGSRRLSRTGGKGYIRM